jgi:hypothetical protein
MAEDLRKHLQADDDRRRLLASCVPAERLDESAPMQTRDVNLLVLNPTPAMPANLRQIFDQCIKAIQQKQTSPVPGPARITLVLSGMSKPSAVVRHLAGRNSPKGEIVADGDGNTQLVSFNCLDLTAWMTANGFLTAEINGQPYPPANATGGN